MTQTLPINPLDPTGIYSNQPYVVPAALTEPRDPSQFLLSGAMWATHNITYSFTTGGTFDGPMDSASQATVRQAFSVWATGNNGGLTFTEVADPSKADIKVGWGIVGNGALGQTTTTSYDGNAFTHGAMVPGAEMHLQDPSIQSIDPATGLYSGSSGTLLQAAEHEIGHALGLSDSTDRWSIMDPNFSYRNDYTTTLGDTTDQASVGLYGLNPPINTGTVLPPVISFSGNESATYRFFDTTNGTQFLTTDVSERNNIIQSRPDLAYEGVGMGAVKHPTTDSNAAPVFRFFDNVHGTHFFTTSASEAATVAATRSDMTQEAPSVFEHMTKQTGDVAVYRFFNSNDGTHFYTNSASENASIIQTRPDMVSEGIAFYAPKT